MATRPPSATLVALEAWHWLAYAAGDTQLLKDPDPAMVFQTAYPVEKYSNSVGLRKLAADSNYSLAAEIAGWYSNLNSPPE